MFKKCEYKNYQVHICLVWREIFFALLHGYSELTIACEIQTLDAHSNIEFYIS